MKYRHLLINNNCRIMFLIKNAYAEFKLHLRYYYRFDIKIQCPFTSPIQCYVSKQTFAQKEQLIKFNTARDLQQTV